MARQWDQREMQSEAEKAAGYCNRAAELRGIAENVKDTEAEDALIKWAETYENVAGSIPDARDAEQ